MLTRPCSWKKLLGITSLKRWFTKKTGIPTTEAGIERKIGRWLIGLITGSNQKDGEKAKKLVDLDEQNGSEKPISNQQNEEETA